MKKRLLSILLVLALALAVLPQAALAAEPACAHEHTEPFSRTYANTRGDLFYMLWLMAGRPEPTIDNPYTDVADTDEYCKAVLWVTETKITAGYSQTTFCPSEPVTRGQAVTFLWRYAGCPEPTLTESPYKDTMQGAYYEKAVCWAAEVDWIDWNASGESFSPDALTGDFTLEGTACEDCGEITQVTKLTVNEAITAQGTWGENLTWKITNGVLVFTGSGEMRDVGEEEDAPWYEYRDQFGQLSLPEGLTSIGQAAFYDCTGLEYVAIPKTVKRIGNAAFLNCTGLSTVDIPAGVEDIGNMAFAGCQDMVNGWIPDSVTHVGYYAFTEMKAENYEDNWTDGVFYLGGWAIYAAEDRASVQIRSDARGIADLAFFECYDLERVTIPQSVKHIGEGAFYECVNLRSVTIPQSVTEIASWTFAYCESLRTVEIPIGVTRIGEAAFFGAGLSDITIPNRECVVETGEEQQAYMLGDPETTTVYGYAGSPAEAYAKQYGYRFTPLSEQVPFVDVPAKAFYSDPVAWALENEITNGVDDIHFGPDRACTRGQVVTFLWRAAGCPEPANAKTSFTDVKSGAYYEKAVAWAVESRITNGTSATTFSPDAACNRGQIVTFLWRFKGEAEPAGVKTPFTDLKPGAFYEKAVAWAVENKITNGLTASTFVPDGPCTRGQVVTFLSRAAAE